MQSNQWFQQLKTLIIPCGCYSLTIVCAIATPEELDKLGAIEVNWQSDNQT
ncbi:hypothetical protein [Kamptonema sp. UHCC 0994]|uniref:hypothetical protein n=1 Tax=Kamptonema sp. UHCC 0994 TaxID=3031329 RepID=UPI0023BA478C|nr:hypothetical protein [Kamptonema sp. UHCC 0994]MDF0556589.1 hypothetical protein [Kamptonema sp. UHCC 0994]